ncbi:MAG TPA: FIST N-terminal domain-containing protein [Kofleriaceae bacterium]|jgi:anti-anti-sigma regulatory factor
MQVQSLTYDLAERRWSARFPAGDSPRTLVTVFGAPSVQSQPDLLVEVARAYPRSLVIGCSTAGEIHGTAVRDNSLAVTVTRFDRTDLMLVSADCATVADSQRAGDELAKKLQSKQGLRAVLALCDGLSVDGAAFSRALGTALGPSVVVTGGLAADGLDFKQTWLTVGGSLKRGSVAAVGFYGPNVVIGHGTSSDWIPLEAEWVITRCEGNYIYELDYQPAVEVYRAALTDRGDELPDVSVWFPLAVHTGSATPVIRSVINIDEADGALILAGEVRNGQVAKLLTADLENLIEGGARAASAATKTGAPVSVDCLALAISCFSRRKILGLWSGEEISQLREGLHAQRTAVTGFYGYGQISPNDGAPALHNQTLSLTVFSEARAADPAPSRLPRATPPAIPVVAPAGYTVRSALYDAKKLAWSTPLVPELDSPKTLVLAFGAPELSREKPVFDALWSAYPNSVILGCSTAGEIYGHDVRDSSLSISVTRFARTEIRLATEKVGERESVRAVAQRMAASLAAHPGLRGVLLLSVGLGINGSELVAGLNAELEGQIPIAGGLAGDGTQFSSTWVLAGKEVSGNRIAAVGFYGNHVVLGHGARGGWDRFGLKRTITKSDGNVLFELDGRPALQIYKEYLGERAAQLPASGLSLPLAVRDPVTDHQIVRTLVGIDEATSSLVFAGDVPTGHIAQFMKADVERLINGATHAALMANESGPPASPESLVVAISCVGRRNMLGAHTEEELEAITDTFRSERALLTGFYAYGEISPSGANGTAELHNQAMSLLVISESMTPIMRTELVRKSSEIAAAPPPSPEALSQFAVETDVATQPAVAVSTQILATALTVPQVEPPPPPPKEASRVSELISPSTFETALEEPRGPIVRTPRSEITDSQFDEADRDGLRVVTIRGRITETFKGDVVAKMMRGRVILDLSEVARVTSFGVREWLAMFQAATDLTECYLARCSESVVNQLTMIRAFDGGAKLLSFFAPYLCQDCNKPFERLFDVDLDAQEIGSVSPSQVSCPRCNGHGKFDDDPRSYLAFPGANTRSITPPEIKTLHRAMCAQDQMRAAEDVEMVMEGDVARIRVTGRLSLNIRWRRLFENIDGRMVIDLSSVTAVEPSGLQGLDFHLRTAQCKKPSTIESAPVGLVERFVNRWADDIEIKSIVVPAFCPSCNVARTATVRLTKDVIDGQRPTALCKRCDNRLELTIEPVIDQYLQKVREQLAPPPPRPSSLLIPHAPSAPLIDPSLAVSLPPVPLGELHSPWERVPRKYRPVILGVLGAIVLAVIVFKLVGNKKPTPKTQQIVAPVQEKVVITPDARTPDPEPTPHAALPPGWADQPVSNDDENMYFVGRSSLAEVDAALPEARAEATQHLIDQLVTDIGTPWAKTAKGRAKLTEQFGKLAAFQRDELAEVGEGASRKIFVRFRLPRAAYQQIVAKQTPSKTVPKKTTPKKGRGKR